MNRDGELDSLATDDRRKRKAVRDRRQFCLGHRQGPLPVNHQKVSYRSTVKQKQKKLVARAMPLPLHPDRHGGGTPGGGGSSQLGPGMRAREIGQPGGPPTQAEDGDGTGGGGGGEGCKSRLCHVMSQRTKRSNKPDACL